MDRNIGVFSNASDKGTLLYRDISFVHRYQNLV